MTSQRWIWAIVALLVTMSNCDKGLRETEGGGNISSPNYPKKFDRSSFCIWRIQAEPNQKIIIDVDDVEMNTYYQWVQIFDGDRCYARNRVFTGVEKGKFTTHGPAIVMFHSAGYPHRGFHLSYKQVHCGGLFEEGTRGRIVWPDGKASANRYCMWRIHAPAKRHIRMRFSKFTTAYHRDPVQIFDGTRCGRRLAFMTGYVNPGKEIISYESSVIVTFRSHDDEEGNNKFVLEYETVTGNRRNQ